MRKTAGLVVSLAILASALIGAPAAQAANAGSITAGGSSFAGAFISACATDYSAANPSKGTITYTSSNSQTGKDNFTSGSFQLGGTDFTYTNTNGDDKPTNARYVAVTAGPVAIIYNLPSVVNLKLTPQVIAKIYKGDITLWNNQEILSLQATAVKNAINALNVKTISPVYRSKGSGTSDNVSGYLADTTGNFTRSSDWSVATGVATPRGTSASSGTNLKTAVANTTGSIGYIDLKDASTYQKALLRNEAGQYYAPDAKRATTFLNAHSASAVQADGSLRLDWSKVVSGAYNLTLVTYAVVNTTTVKGSTTAEKAENAAKAANLKAFLTYSLNVCGPARAYALGYSPIMGALRTKAGQIIQTIK